MKTKDLLWGVLFILAGAFLLFGKFVSMDFLNISRLWPLFVLVPGLIFELSYFFENKNAGLLVPGGILTTIGILFLFETYTSWHFAAYTWPVYILGVAIGLFQLYWFGGKQRGLLIPVAILTLVAGCSILTMISRTIFSWFDYSYLLSVIFILLGIYLLIRNRKKL